MLDQLLLSLKEVCELLLPVMGVVVLIYLALLFRKLIQLLTKAETLLNNVDNKVTRLEKPLDTVESICGTIDNVHVATVNGVNGAIDYIVHNFSTIMDWFKEVIEKRKGNTVYYHEESVNTEGE
ncbi:MAG: hypothetical protein IKM20_01425 [Erysipelotrichales bacterium]|nr:hypothetical protein [Erysipelotrichales bacterium]